MEQFNTEMDKLRKVVALTAEMADIKVKLRCSQEQFVDMLQKYYTQQLVQLEDPDAVPDWVMLSFRNELSQIFKDFKGYPKITQGQWIRILKTALQDAQDMEKELNAQPDHEVMEVPDKVLWTQKGGKGRYQLQPNDPPQEPSCLALFNNMDSENIVETANDAQGYVKSELQKLNINEIDKLLDSSESDQKPSDLDNVPDLIEDMKSKILLLEQALESQELTMLRLRQHAKNMEEEQGELRALHAELQLSVKRSQSYWEQKLSQDLLNKEALRKFMVLEAPPSSSFMPPLRLGCSFQVVALTAEMADIKVKLRCSQEQFVDMLQKYYTQQLVQLEDPDAVPDWVMLSFRNELSQIFKDFKGYPKITQGQWIRILKTALQDAQDMEKELNAQPDHEVMEVPDKVLWTQKGGQGRYQLQPNDPPQEPSCLALFNNMDSENIVETANDAQGYVKSELQKLNINEIDKLLDNSESDQKLSDLDNVPDLIEDMKSKILLLEQALESQELTMLRLRKDAKNMEEEQGELRALHAELQLSVKRSQSYWEQKLSQDLVNKDALRKFMETHQMSELDLRQLMQKSPQIDHKPQDSVKEVVDV
ncbi:unnamed protein product [Cladocopium goreaui]|uniref:Uncharacterized protein n=1 Tax=Cladocopium goreaui TaxID=2562237 RepID=A0A9P1DRF9_9DINO|nr:unnamed protein product [Cladocopium goreaui]